MRARDVRGAVHGPRLAMRTSRRPAPGRELGLAGQGELAEARGRPQQVLGGEEAGPALHAHGAMTVAIGEGERSGGHVGLGAAEELHRAGQRLATRERLDDERIAGRR
jgi:hypothetical protein